MKNQTEKNNRRDSYESIQRSRQLRETPSASRRRRAYGSLHSGQNENEIFSRRQVSNNSQYRTYQGADRVPYQRQQTRRSYQAQQNAQGGQYSNSQYAQHSAYRHPQRQNFSASQTLPPAYSRRRGIKRGPRKWLVILIIIAVFVVVAGAIFVFTKCSAQQSNNASLSTSGATPAPDGRIVMTMRGTADTILLRGEEYIEPGCRATDKEDGDISKKINTEGDVDNNKTGDYTITYSAVNSQNMEAKAQRTVHVVDNIDADQDGIAVMMYHNVYDEANPPSDVARNSNYISTAKLDEQLAWLTNNNYYYPSYKELKAYIDGKHTLPSKSVVLTFDDADGGFLTNGIPLLQKHKVPATTFVICNKSFSPRLIKEYANPYLDFQSHTYACHEGGNTKKGRGGHIYDLNLEGLTLDFNKAAEICGSNEAMAYPYGDVSDVSSEACKRAGILCAFTIKNGLVKKGDDSTQLPRMRVLKDTGLSGWIYEVEHGTGK